MRAKDDDSDVDGVNSRQLSRVEDLEELMYKKNADKYFRVKKASIHSYTHLVRPYTYMYGQTI